MPFDMKNRPLLFLLRKVENRFCADCSASFGDDDPFGSYSFGSWICSKCAQVHRSLDGTISRIKSAADDWTDEEVGIHFQFLLVYLLRCCSSFFVGQRHD